MPALRVGAMTEESSVTRAEATFEDLLAPVLEPAYGAAMHMCRNRHDAEDLVQEAALQAFRSFHQFQPGTKFKAWFFRILTNLFYYRYRKQKRAPQTIGLEDTPDLYLAFKFTSLGLFSGNLDPAESILGKLEADHVREAIANLPDEFRIVAALYFIEDFSYEEIAQILEKPVGTVRSRLHRGRRMLQKALWTIAEERGIVAAMIREASS